MWNGWLLSDTNSFQESCEHTVWVIEGSPLLLWPQKSFGLQDASAPPSSTSCCWRSTSAPDRIWRCWKRRVVFWGWTKAGVQLWITVIHQLCYDVKILSKVVSWLICCTFRWAELFHRCVLPESQVFPPKCQHCWCTLASMNTGVLHSGGLRPLQAAFSRDLSRD